MQNNLLDYKQDEQSIKKVIDKEINGKSKRLFDPNSYYSQFQNLTQESLQECEKTQVQKGAKEMIEFKAQVTSQEKVIEAIRAANFVEIQNVNFRFKRLLKEILEQIADQLGNLFKNEYLKLWLEWKNAKSALQEKEVKLKISEMNQQIQEQELIQIRTEFTAQNTFLGLNKQLEASLLNLETENNKLKENLKHLNQQCNELKQNNEDLNKRMKKLEQQYEEAKEKYENEINQLKQKEQNLIKANQDLIELNNQLSQQLDKYRDLYEMQNQRNNDLTDQVRYWKSTHYNQIFEDLILILIFIIQISIFYKLQQLQCNRDQRIYNNQNKEQDHKKGIFLNTEEKSKTQKDLNYIVKKHRKNYQMLDRQFIYQINKQNNQDSVMKILKKQRIQIKYYYVMLNQLKKQIMKLMYFMNPHKKVNLIFIVLKRLHNLQLMNQVNLLQVIQKCQFNQEELKQEVLVQKRILNQKLIHLKIIQGFKNLNYQHHIQIAH